MQKLLTPLLIVLLIGCKSTSKMMMHGNYDSAINKSVKKILKGKADNEDIQTLDKAYNLANQRDLDRIKLLKAEAKPENWESIFTAYYALDNRQKNVRKVLPLQLNGRTINYSQIDYTNEIVEAKTRAAEFYYADGKAKMKVGTKDSYRMAFSAFAKARQYRESAFPDILQLMNEAKYLGTVRALVEVSNGTNIQLPPDFYEKLLSFNTASLNNQWTEYHITRLDNQTKYDYHINILLQQINVSPEGYDTKEYLRKNRVEDGFSYALDKRGNVMKDSSGNDIKIPKYKDLQCTVIQSTQRKDANVKGEIQYISKIEGRVMKKVPIESGTFFEHVSGKAVGDLEALLPGDKTLIEKDPVEFPADINMIYDSAEALRKSISDALNDNRYLVK